MGDLTVGGSCKQGHFLSLRDVVSVRARTLVMEKATNMVTRGLNQEGTCIIYIYIIYKFIYIYIYTYSIYIYVALDFTSDDLINFIMLI